MVGLSLESGRQGSFWYLLTGEKADPTQLGAKMVSDMPVTKPRVKA